MLTENPSLYINRELSWIRFNRHVLDEAMDGSHPLLERVKFLSIFANNLDEFFMIRVSGLQRQLEKGVLKAPPDGMTAGQQLDAIHQMLLPELQIQDECWHKELLPRLAGLGIILRKYESLTYRQKSEINLFFIE